MQLSREILYARTLTGEQLLQNALGLLAKSLLRELVGQLRLKLWRDGRQQISVVRQARGGYPRIPEGKLDGYLYRAPHKTPLTEKRGQFRRISGRNQLIGRIIQLKIERLLAQVTLSIGGQRITSIITADAARELRLQEGQTAAARIKATEVMILRV